MKDNYNDIMYSPPSVVAVIMSREMKWAGHAAGMGR
jgi:hypothetical protein